MEYVLTEKKDNICWLTLNRPEEHNPLSLEMMYDMINKMKIIAKDRNL